MHTLPPGNYLKLLGEPNSITTTHQLGIITGRAKFNYNHPSNNLELLREHKFNYNHMPKGIELGPGSLLLSTKRET